MQVESVRSKRYAQILGASLYCKCEVQVYESSQVLISSASIIYKCKLKVSGARGMYKFQMKVFLASLR